MIYQYNNINIDDSFDFFRFVIGDLKLHQCCFFFMLFICFHEKKNAYCFRCETVYHTMPMPLNEPYTVSLDRKNMTKMIYVTTKSHDYF